LKNNEVADHSDEDSSKYRVKRRKNARHALGAILLSSVVILSLSVAFYVGVVKRRRKSISGAAPVPGDTNLLRKVPDNESDIAALANSELEVADIVSVRGKRNIAEIVPTRDWRHCIDHPPSPKDGVSVEFKIEPLWLPAYPTSLPNAGYAEFLSTLTGVPKAAKSYYRSSPTLKRCHNPHTDNKVQAVTCEIVHPIVPCQRPHPSKQADRFGSKVVVGLRNPLTAFSAVQQMKAEAYHGQKGQVEKEQWEEFRDQYVGTTSDSHLLNEWKNFIVEWRDMKPYSVDTYMPWEYWIDDFKGPALAKRFALALKEEGFPVLYDGTEVECLWHRYIYEPLVAENKKLTEEGWYDPEYTTVQLELIASELEKFGEEIKEKLRSQDEENGRRPGDEHLIAILYDYASTVRDLIHKK